MYILYFLKGFLELNGYNDDLIPNFYLFICIIIVWLPNYLYLRKEKFLDCDFLFGIKNVILCLIIILIIGTIFMSVAVENRERLFRQRVYSQEVINNGSVEPFDPKKEPASLEDNIKLWYYHTFEKDDSTKK